MALWALCAPLRVAAASVGEDAAESHARAMDQFIRGTVADQMEDYYRAVFHYQEALRYDSTSAFILVALAQDYLLLGNPAQGAELIDRALKARPDYLPALELKALLLRGTGNLAEARDALRKLVQFAPKNAQYLRQLLAVELNLENFDEADKLYHRIIDVEGDSDLLTRQVLAVYLTSGQPARAAVLLEKLIASDSTDAGLVYTLGTVYLQQGDSTRGEALILKANRMDPTEPRFWSGRAVLAMDKQDYEGAVTILDSAQAHVTPNAGMLSLKGTALNRVKRQTEAVAVFRQAIDLDSTQFVAMGALALIYDQLDSVPQAVSLYERAITLSDSAAIYLNNLAYTWASRGLELERARALAEAALTRRTEERRLSRYDGVDRVRAGAQQGRDPPSETGDRADSRCRGHIGTPRGCVPQERQPP